MYSSTGGERLGDEVTAEADADREQQLFLVTQHCGWLQR